MANVKAMAVILMALWSALVFQSAYGDGECGKTPIRTVVVSLTPCIGAASDAKASVPAICCIQVKKVLSFPTCLCAVYSLFPGKQNKTDEKTDEIVQRIGFNMTSAITIPIRCNIRNFLDGQKCGNKTIT
jgi:hypothetical protein